MKKKRTLLYHSLIFILAQIAWLTLLGLWIYWYVSNYVIMEQMGEELSKRLFHDETNVFPFVVGLVLFVGVSFGMSMTFRRLNLQLRIAKMYDNFIANVTHELKSPLSSIQLCIETMSTRDVPIAKQKEFLRLMAKDSDRLNKLINSILEISRLEQKKISHDYHVFEAEQLIRKLLVESAEQFKLSPEALEISGSARCSCAFDPRAFKIALDNLIDNAVKYSLNAPHIKVDLYCSRKKFIIELSDSGIGISADDQNHIFEKFHRIYNKDIPNVKGTGLGLFWVKGIINAHGGSISVRSEGLNSGTTFIIELPVYQVSRKKYVNKLLKSTLKREKSGLGK